MLLGDRYGGHFAAVVASSVHTEAAPPRADFQHAVGRNDMQTPAEFVVFPDLCCLQALIGIFKIGARIGHRGIQPEFEEVVAQVVVFPDVLLAHRTAIVTLEVEGSIESI